MNEGHIDDRLTGNRGNFKSVPVSGLQGSVILGDEFYGDVLAVEKYLATFRRQEHLEPEKNLMLAVLEDAMSVYQKNTSARRRQMQKEFHETEDWIFQTGWDGVFSFETICETLGINPSYLRSGLMRLKNEYIKAHQPHQNSRGPLTSLELEVIKAAANLYNKSKSSDIFSYVSRTLGIRIETVRSRFNSIYAHLNAHDRFSSAYLALTNGLNPEELADGKLEDFIKRLDTLTDEEKAMLKAYGEHAVKYGRIKIKEISESLKILYREMHRRKYHSIYPKLDIRNDLQLAVAAYLLYKGTNQQTAGENPSTATQITSQT